MVSYAYDAANRPVAMTFSDDTADYTYDYSPAGRVLTAARVKDSAVAASSAYAYDEGVVQGLVTTDLWC
jgi:YD repeat-containing protein